jgi:hypothetical protein
VKISAAFGKALFPDPQWDRIASLWERLYPLSEARPHDAGLFRLLESVLPRFVGVVLGHRGERLGGATLGSIFPRLDRSPDRLRGLWLGHRRDPSTLARLSPTIAFAVVGQARHDGALTPAAEAGLLRRLLRYWALRGTIDASEVCSLLRRPQRLALAV